MGDITYIAYILYIYIYKMPQVEEFPLFTNMDHSFIIVLFALALNISYSYFIFYNLQRKSYF